MGDGIEGTSRSDFVRLMSDKVNQTPSWVETGLGCVRLGRTRKLVNVPTTLLN